VPNCKSFLVTEAERKHVKRRARFQHHRDVSCWLQTQKVISVVHVGACAAWRKVLKFCKLRKIRVEIPLVSVIYKEYLPCLLNHPAVPLFHKPSLYLLHYCLKETHWLVVEWILSIPKLLMTREVHTEFWWGELMERVHLEDLGGDGRII